MFLAVNNTTSIHEYYSSLKFEQVSSWNIVGDQVKNCAILESGDISDLLPMRITVPMNPPDYSTRSLILRTCLEIPRVMASKSPQYTPGHYQRKMKNVLTNYVEIPLKPDKYLNEKAAEKFNELFPSRQCYHADGPEWEKFHDYWTGKSMMNYWDIKRKFDYPSSTHDRKMGTLLLMKYYIIHLIFN